MVFLNIFKVQNEWRESRGTFVCFMCADMRRLHAIPFSETIGRKYWCLKSQKENFSEKLFKF